MARLSLSQLTRFCRRMGIGLRAGVDVRQLCQQETRRGPSRYRMYMGRLNEQVTRGEALADAMKACDGYFPSLACDMVDIGERTGRVEAAFLRLADHYDHVQTLRRTFISGISFPLFQLGIGILVIGLLIVILGAIKPAEGEPVGVFGLYGMTGLMIYVAILALFAGSLSLLLVGLKRGWFGPLPTAIFIRLPVVGDCLQTLAVARFAWTLAMSLEAGIDARRAMALSLRATQNAYYLVHAQSLDQTILRGGAYHEAVAKTGAFPRDFVDLLESAEIAGTQSEAMVRLAEEYQNKAQATAKTLAVLAAFTIWAMIAVVFLVVIVKLISTLYIKPIKDMLEMGR